MKIAVLKKGRDRIAFIFPPLGLVVKLPRIRLFIAVKELLKSSGQCFFGSQPEYYRVHLWLFLIRKIDARGAFVGFKSLLFGGLADNWNEFIFFVRTRNKFLQPTYFSFLGLINLQKYGEPTGLNYRSLWHQIIDLIGPKDCRDDAHHFSSPANFCLQRGKLRILDYGSRATQKIVAKYGEKIYDCFDPKKI
jgi:hypothetical protein